jgi:hypothetical protein
MDTFVSALKNQMGEGELRLTMYAAESMYAAVFGRGVARLYAGWKMRFCTFSTIVNSTAATEALRSARRGSAERVLEPPPLAAAAHGTEGERRQLQDEDSFRMTISGQVDLSSGLGLGWRPPAKTQNESRLKCF